jgi:type II secretory pathway component PulM
MALPDTLRESWEKLTDRERQMLLIMGSVATAIVVFVAVWSTSSALAEVEEERDEIRKVLNTIDRSGEQLERLDRERKAAAARYQVKPPPLAAFLEMRAKEEGLEVRQVVEQPSKEIDGYRRQHVRINLASVGLRPVMRLLANLESEQMPLAVERVQIDHYQTGDSYNVQIGVITFEGQPKAAKRPAVAEEAAP